LPFRRAMVCWVRFSLFWAGSFCFLWLFGCWWLGFF